MIRLRLAAAALLLPLCLTSSARAEEPPPASTSEAPPPRRGMSTGNKMMIAGGAIFGAGYLMYGAAALACERDCDGMGKLAVPFVGYGLYMADPERRAEAARDEAADQRARARGDGCMNSAIGCGFGDTMEDIGAVLAWIPTVLQVGGAAIFIAGLATSGGETKPAAPPPPAARWSPGVHSVPGGATFGIGGTF